MKTQSLEVIQEVGRKVIKLSTPIPIKCIRYSAGYENYPLRIGNLVYGNSRLDITKIQEADCIAHWGPNDDQQTRILDDGTKLFNSYDSGRGYIIYPNNEVDIVNPSDLGNWKTCRKFAKGMKKGNRVWIDTIYIYN